MASSEHRTNKKYLVIQTAFLGDIVLTTPLLKVLVDDVGTKSVHLVTTSVGADVLVGFPKLATHVLVKNKSSFVRQWRSFKSLVQTLKIIDFDAVLLVHPSVRSTVLAWCVAGFKNRRKVRAFAVLHRRWLAPFLGFQLIPQLPLASGLSYAQKVCELLPNQSHAMKNLIANKNYLPYLPSPKLGVSESFKLKKPYILICPFTAWGTKMWFADRWVEVIRELAGSFHDVTFVMVGPSGEREKVIAKTLMQRLSEEVTSRVQNLVGQTNLSELKGLFSKAALVLTNDSANTHLASAFNVPTVTIFGPTIPAFGFQPLSDRRRIIEPVIALDCRPCSAHGPQTCPKRHFRCMDSISAESVVQAARDLLS